MAPCIKSLLFGYDRGYGRAHACVRIPLAAHPFGAALRHEDLEAELRLAVAEGYTSEEEVGLLREEALQQGRSPLEVLK